MTDSEVITLSPPESLDNQNGRNGIHDENSLDSNEEWDWDKYCNFEFYDEFQDYASSEDEQLESEEQTDINEDNPDVNSTPTIVTPEEIELEISDKSENSSTHFCFREIAISDSQLKIRNLFNFYPIPDDPGILPAFWIIFHKEKLHKEHYKKFENIAKIMNLRPINCLKDMFKKSEVNLRYYGLDSRILKAISRALIDNNSVVSLDLKDNWLSVDACFHLNELLSQDTVLVTLNLSGCKIGDQGAEKFQEGLAFAPNLLNLNMSRCNLGDEGFHHIHTGIYLSETIQNLNLSDNHLGENCAKDFGAMISKSQSLVRLNLSWNSLHHKETCKAIFNSLTESKTIEEIDLSWNGISSECTSYICSSLSKPSNLKILNLKGELNLSIKSTIMKPIYSIKYISKGNRFVDSDVQQMAKILSKNSTLEQFYIGNNPFKAAGALVLIQALILDEASESKLRLLDLENIWLKKDALPTLEIIENTKPWLNIKFGGILSNYKLVGPNEKQILLKRANFEAINTKKKKQRKNFGHFILSLEDSVIPIVKFAKLVKDSKLKLSDTLVQAIGKAFVVGKNFIDQRELKSFYMKEYPNTVLPPIDNKKTKRKKGKEGKKEKKEVMKKNVKGEKSPKVKKKQVEIKEEQSKLEKIPESEILSREFEIENEEDNWFEDFEY